VCVCVVVVGEREGGEDRDLSVDSRARDWIPSLTEIQIRQIGDGCFLRGGGVSQIINSFDFAMFTLI